jgi:hypothetical protein
LNDGTTKTISTTGVDQVAVQRVEVLRMAAEGCRHAAARLDVDADFRQQLGEVRVCMAARDDVDRLQQRHAGLEHGRQLAREVGDVLAGDLLAARGAPALGLGDRQALFAMFSARISPLKILPLRSLPSHSKTYCVAAFLAAVLRAGAAAVALFWAGRAAGARVAMVGSYPPVWERLIEKVIGSL